MEQQEEEKDTRRTGTEISLDAQSLKVSNLYEVPLIQIMNEINDEYLVELPETLAETL